MNDIPFAIPRSLASYVLQFDNAPDKTITRLSKQLEKRGPDPVGYFLLAWFYHRKEMQPEAREAAMQAKNFAPGSPFFEKLPYFFSHPKLFEAWYPEREQQLNKNEFKTYDGVIGDLNALIEKLSAVESSGIRQTDIGSAPKIDREETDDVDELVSETLAEIHEKQGNFEESIKIYQKLKQRHTEKKSFYNRQIKQLEKKKAESEKE